MTHDLFGRLKYHARDEEWAGHAPLVRFASIGMRAPEAPLSEGDLDQQIVDMNLAVENMKKLMVERFGDRVATALAEVDREADEQLAMMEEQDNIPPDPREEERERRRIERTKKHAARLAKGEIPIRIATPPEAEPTAAQEGAFRFLTENELSVFDSVLVQVWESFQSAYEQEEWRLIAGVKPAATLADLLGRFAVTQLEIAHESRGGFAHLIFHVDSDWQDEDGLLIVYSPDTRTATWTSFDGLCELVESDDSYEEDKEYIPSPHDELLEAILTGDDAKARQLAAAGADINALGPDEYPPLWLSVEHMEVDEVRSLLAHGADPKLANADDKTTPLKHAKKLYRQMGFAPTKSRDGMVDAMMALAREAMGKQYDDLKHRMEEIIRLLEAVAAESEK